MRLTLQYRFSASKKEKHQRAIHISSTGVELGKTRHSSRNCRRTWCSSWLIQKNSSAKAWPGKVLKHKYLVWFCGRPKEMQGRNSTQLSFLYKSADSYLRLIGLQRRHLLIFVSPRGKEILCRVNICCVEGGGVGAGGGGVSQELQIDFC
jgi:hypothetical protein